MEPDSSTTEHPSHCGADALFFLELLLIALQPSPAAHWTSSDLGGSCSGVTSFCLIILFTGFLRQEYTEELYKKDLHDPDNHDGVITHLEPDILESKVKQP